MTPDSTASRTPRTAAGAPLPRRALVAVLLGAPALLGGCSATLLPKPPPQPALYALDDAAPVPAPVATPAPAAPPAAAATPAPAAAAAPSPRASAAAKPTLLVNPPRAAAGFDTRNIVYLRQPHQIEFFAFSQWVDTPAQMLAPLVARAVERSGAFDAVLLAPSAAAGELRLDTEVIRLQQDFGSTPSQVRFTLRAVLLDTRTRRVVAVREFDASAPAASDDAPGGVAAANRAVQQVLGELAAFTATAATAPAAASER